jgi:hypothetical protein
MKKSNTIQILVFGIQYPVFSVLFDGKIHSLPITDHRLPITDNLSLNLNFKPETLNYLA